MVRSVRVGSDLGRDELYYGTGNHLAVSQGPGWVPEEAELDGEAETVGGTSADGDRRQVGLGKGVVADQLALGHLRDPARRFRCASESNSRVGMVASSPS